MGGGSKKCGRGKPVAVRKNVEPRKLPIEMEKMGITCPMCLKTTSSHKKSHADYCREGRKCSWYPDGAPPAQLKKSSGSGGGAERSTTTSTSSSSSNGAGTSSSNGNVAGSSSVRKLAAALVKPAARERRTVDAVIKETHVNDIVAGSKTYECRPRTRQFANVQAGDRLSIRKTRFQKGATIYASISEARQYTSFSDMLDDIGFIGALPACKNKAEALNCYLGIGNYAQEAKTHGVVALRLGS